MKKAISTLACHGWTLDKAIEQCLQNGIDALEIRTGLHPWSQLDLTDEEYKQIYGQLEKAGLCVSDLGTSVVIQDDDQKALEELERCAQIANILHCRGLRIMLGNFYNRRSEPRKKVDEMGIVSWLKKADKLMERYNTQVWIETHNEYACGKALYQLMQKGDFKNIKLLWDIMHPLEAGESIEESYRYMKEYLVHVHVKDGQPWDDPDMENYRYTDIGKGIIPMEKIIRLLDDAGYQGYFSLEWEGIWRKELQTEEYSPEKAIRDFSDMMQRIEQV